MDQQEKPEQALYRAYGMREFGPTRIDRLILRALSFGPDLEANLLTVKLKLQIFYPRLN